MLGTLRTPAVNHNLAYDAATQTVTISAGEINYYWPNWISHPNGIKHVKFTGPVTIQDGNADELFYRLSDLQDITGLNNLDTSNVTEMELMFSGDSSLTNLDLSSFDTSKVTNMYQMFGNMSSLTSFSVPSSWDTSKVTNMSQMFIDDSALTSLDVSNLDTSKVTNMTSMFLGDTALTNLDISNFDTKTNPNATGMMFIYDDKLEKITLGDNTRLNSSNIFNPAYNDPDHPTEKVDLNDGKNHTGTWYSYANGTIKLSFVNEFNNEQVGTATLSGRISNNTTDLDFTNATTRATYIIPKIPAGYEYFGINPSGASYTFAGTPITVYVTGDPTTNLKINYALPNGTAVGTSYTPQGHHVGDKLTLDKTFYDAHPLGGYSYASESDLVGTGKSQPGEITYTANTDDPTKEQTATIYVTADSIPNDGTNTDAIHVLHYLQGTETDVGGSYWVGGHYGEKVTISDSDARQAVAGYTIVPQASQAKTLTYGTQQHVIFYYTANVQNNITVKFETKDEHVVKSDAPDGYHTGETLDLSASGNYVTAAMPKGYTYATNASDMPSGKHQPDNLTYKDNDPQIAVIYVTANKVPSTGDHATDQVHVLHYLQKSDGTQTDTVVPGSYWQDGYYGDSVTISDTDAKQKVDGYTIVPQAAETRTFKYGVNPDDVVFYYTANKVPSTGDHSTDQVHVLHYLQKSDGTQTDTVVPGSYWQDGYYGDSVTISDTDAKQTVPGYTIVPQAAETRTFQYGVSPADVKFYYTADVQNNITVKFETKDEHIVKSDTPEGYHTGDTLDLSASGSYVTGVIPGGYTYATNASDMPNGKHQPDNLTYKDNDPQTAIIYVTADANSKITITYKNAKTGQTVGAPYTPSGHHTGDPLDLKTVQMPDGYHYASDEELSKFNTANHTSYVQQDPNMSYTAEQQNATVYVAGDSVPNDDSSTDSVLVKHYLDGTTKEVPGLSDYYLGGAYGDKVTPDLTDSHNTAPGGYSLVSTSSNVGSKVLTKGTSPRATIIVYYSADQEEHLSVQFVNARTGKDVGNSVKAPTGYMNETFDPTDSNSFITDHIPAGYHYATTSDELNGKTQPKNDGSVKYTDQADIVTVYVAGDNVPNDGSNTDAVHVLHYLQGTTTDIGGSHWVGGYYGETVTIKDSDAGQTVAGYTVVPQAAVTRTLTYGQTPDNVIFYYTAKEENTVTINFATKNGTVVSHTNPTGCTGAALTLGESYFNDHKPAGYHYASGNEIPSGEQQPASVTFTADPQTVTVYVAGESVETGDIVKVVHYMEGTTKPVPGLTDYVLGANGHYGDTVTASGDDAAQKAPFGYKLVNPDVQTYVLTKGAPGTFIFYYTKNGGGSLPEPDRTPKLPIPGEVDIPQDTDLSNDTTYASNAIKNQDQMPAGTKYSWQPAPDTSKKGTQQGTVVVTYPDGTKVSVNVTVNIIDKNDNSTNSNTGNNNHGEAKEELLKHNAYLYGQDGKRENKAVLKAGSTVTTYGMVIINGRKFFTLDNDYYLAAGNAISQTRKLKHNAYIYNKYGKRVGKKVMKTGQSMATYGTVVTIRGKKYYTIDHDHFMKANNFTKIAYPDLANSELSPNVKQDNKQFTVKALQHNAYLYNKEGKRANKVILNLNSKVKTYGTTTINVRKFYVAGNDYYIAAGNIDATKRKLTHNAYIYSQYGNRIGRKVVKQHQVVGIYGDPVGIRGKSYYIIGSGRYLKRANFETR